MFHRLENRGNDYYINCKKNFHDDGLLSEDDIENCFSFAYDMTFGNRGEHRNHRTGGQTRRRKGEIFIDTFQGKIAEFAFYKYCKGMGVEVSEPDMSVMGLNQWDGCDFSFGGKQIAIKSTKFFGSLLLLETKDWNDNGEYIPNLGTGHELYDFFVLVKIKPDGASIMKRKRWLYSDEIKKDDLKAVICQESWQCGISGYITNEELIEIISNDYVLPQNSMLNGKTRMDAENYYVQDGDMHSIEEMFCDIRH